MKVTQFHQEVLSELPESPHLALALLNKTLKKNSKLFFKNLSNLSKETNEKQIIGNFIWKVLVEMKPLFFEKDFKEIQGLKNSKTTVLNVVFDMLKMFIFLSSVNLKGVIFIRVRIILDLFQIYSFSLSFKYEKLF